MQLRMSEEVSSTAMGLGEQSCKEDGVRVRDCGKACRAACWSIVHPASISAPLLCYVMLCYVQLCYVMLCYVMLCYVMLCYVCYVMSNEYSVNLHGLLNHACWTHQLHIQLAYIANLGLLAMWLASTS